MEPHGRRRRTRNGADRSQRVRDASWTRRATGDHGWSAKASVRGRRLTSTVGIRDDVINAGAEWVDAPAVIDVNIVSARVPKDLPAFGRAMLEVLSKQG